VYARPPTTTIPPPPPPPPPEHHDHTLEHSGEIWVPPTGWNDEKGVFSNINKDAPKARRKQWNNDRTVRIFFFKFD
jgi:hypothetical protein